MGSHESDFLEFQVMWLCTPDQTTVRAISEAPENMSQRMMILERDGVSKTESVDFILKITCFYV